MKKLISIMLCAAITVGLLVIPAVAEREVSVYLNGERLQFDVAPIIVDGRTMVPMRVVFETFGMEVDWIDDEYDIAKIFDVFALFNEVGIYILNELVEIPNAGIFDWVDYRPFVFADDKQRAIALQINSYAMLVANDADMSLRWIELDVAPFIAYGRTLVPLRAIAEGLGANVGWCDDTWTVSISTEEERPPLIMATNAEFPPFQFLSNAPTAVDGVDGICVAIAVLIAEELGKELRIVDMEFTSIIPAVMAGYADIGMAGMTITEERSTVVNFTVAYYTNSQVILARADSGIQSAADLAGLRVGVILNFTGDFIVSGIDGIAEVARANDAQEALADLYNGRVDAIVIDGITARFFVDESNLSLTIIEDYAVFSSENYGIAVRQGNYELLHSINAIIERLIEDGTIDEIVIRYTLY